MFCMDLYRIVPHCYLDYRRAVFIMDHHTMQLNMDAERRAVLHMDHHTMQLNMDAERRAVLHMDHHRAVDYHRLIVHLI